MNRLTSHTTSDGNPLQGNNYLPLRWLLAIVLALGAWIPWTPTAVQAQAAPTLVAVRISMQTPLNLGTPLHPTFVPDKLVVPRGVPPGSLVRFVIQGVVKARDPGSQEWQIGAQPAFVYSRVGTLFDDNIQVGDMARVTANRSLDISPIIAERITRIQAGPIEPSPATTDVTFLFNGAVGATGTHIWNVGGRDFVVDSATRAAVIEAGLGANSPVTVEFTVEAAPTFTALEILPQTPKELPTPLHPKPRVDATAMPERLPAGSAAQFVIQGIVTARDASAQEWQIGTQPTFVYTHTATRLVNNPGVGDLVKVVASRSLTPGPLAADIIALEQAGPAAPTPAKVEVSFQFVGAVGTVSSHMWTVGSADFIVDDQVTPAVIAAGLSSNVSVRFSVPGFVPTLPTATPAAARTPVQTALAPITDRLVRVWGYDADTQTWKVYDPALPPELNSVTQLEVGKVYYINVRSASAITTGTETRQFSAGWNTLEWKG